MLHPPTQCTYYTSHLVHEILANQDMTVIPQIWTLKTFFFVPNVEIHSERLPISDDRRKFAMGPTRYPRKIHSNTRSITGKTVGSCVEAVVGSTLKETSLVKL
jgi:hypothetical protein